ncbi:hypothetical protein M1N24_02655, partial [Dehalococcoidia bacterium]|nr:hypothetical protein [Dehalococcoidia bacterium]
EYSNNMGSLWCAYPWVSERPFVYLHGDVIYHPDLLRKIIESPPSFGALLVEFGPVDEEAMKVRTQNEFMVESSKTIPLHEAQGEWIGIARFSAKASRCVFRTMDKLLGQGYLTSYDTLAFSQLATLGTQFKAISTDGLPWVEVDDSLDLRHARAIFT